MMFMWNAQHAIEATHKDELKSMAELKSKFEGEEYILETDPRLRMIEALRNWGEHESARTVTGCGGGGLFESQSQKGSRIPNDGSKFELKETILSAGSL